MCHVRRQDLPTVTLKLIHLKGLINWLIAVHMTYTNFYTSCDANELVEPARRNAVRPRARSNPPRPLYFIIG
jgi:hypothetical protein